MVYLHCSRGRRQRGLLTLRRVAIRGANSIRGLVARVFAGALRLDYPHFLCVDWLILPEPVVILVSIPNTEKHSAYPYKRNPRESNCKLAHFLRGNVSYLQE